MIGRREFIAGLGAAASPVVARAQQRAVMPVIGFLGGASASQYTPFVAAYHRGLEEIGYFVGQNVAIEYRWADGQYSRLPALAADLVARQVTVISAAGSTPATLAAKAATTTIPIVFFVGGDPVELGLVASLGHPGGNLTGFTALTAEVGSKRLQVMHEVVPAAKKMALLVNPTSPAQSEPQSRDLEAAARQLGLQLEVIRASTDREIESAIATLGQSQAGGLVIGPDVFFNTRSEQIAALALRHKLPTIYQYREFVAAGGFMSYGTSLTELFRLGGTYTGRILKGDKAAELPVQQATKIELFINLATAKALGLTIPETLLATADEVIQ
jgi:putative tryptophan/tyrosine transport system substrate-binding protein